jgi:hypothetical protein
LRLNETAGVSSPLGDDQTIDFQPTPSAPRLRVIDIDRNPAYPAIMAALMAEGMLSVKGSKRSSLPNCFGIVR